MKDMNNTSSSFEVSLNDYRVLSHALRDEMEWHYDEMGGVWIPNNWVHDERRIFVTVIDMDDRFSDYCYEGDAMLRSKYDDVEFSDEMVLEVIVRNAGEELDCVGALLWELQDLEEEPEEKSGCYCYPCAACEAAENDEYVEDCRCDDPQDIDCDECEEDCTSCDENGWSGCGDCAGLGYDEDGKPMMRVGMTREFYAEMVTVMEAGERGSWNTAQQGDVVAWACAGGPRWSAEVCDAGYMVTIPQGLIKGLLH